MNELVFKTEKGKASTTSLMVAEKFGKEHKNVIASIKNIVQSAENTAHLYCLGSYNDSLGRKQEMYLMSRDGFSLLSMGFTGNEALKFKLDFINAFNSMESFIVESIKPKELSKLEALQMALESEQARIIAENKILELTPKAEVFDSIMNTSQLIDLRELSGLLNIKNLGRNNLFKLLQQRQILSSKNIPYREYIDRGYFQIKETKIKKGDSIELYIKTFVTQKGVNWITKGLMTEVKEGGLKQNM